MTSRQVTLINSGLSNIDSIARALRECGGSPSIARDPADLADAHRIVLPGVGAFSAAMERLAALGMIDALQEQLDRRPVPLLGICLGMQLLVEASEEDGEHAGLGLLPGRVVRLVPTEPTERVPHIGWNEVEPVNGAALFAGIETNKDFYFVHSYSVSTTDTFVLARTPYCGRLISGIGHDNVMGLQFHPEKSQELGLQVLRNFLAM